MYFILDCKKMTSVPEIHDQLEDVLPLPEYYGRNLDALWDILSTYGEEIEIDLDNFDETPDETRDYVELLISLFEHLAQKRENFRFNVE